MPFQRPIFYYSRADVGHIYRLLLHHPNIAGIYGLEKTGESQALILELVEGEDLSTRLKRGPLPVEESLDGRKLPT